MDIYEYYSRKHKWFVPRTPNAALTGLKKGLLPKESFITKSMFLYSPFGTPGKLKNLSDKEEIQRLQELERILSKKDIDLETECLLIFTLDKLVEHSNPEIALFAAESINSIENRYNKKIYNLKKEITEHKTIKHVCDLILMCFNYGFINKEKMDVKEFYYSESLKLYQNFNYNEFSLEFQILKIRLLNEKKEFKKSRKLIDSIKDISNWHRLLLVLEIEFEARKFENISKIVKDIDLNNIPLQYRYMVEQWLI